MRPSRSRADLQLGCQHPGTPVSPLPCQELMARFGVRAHLHCVSLPGHLVCSLALGQSLAVCFRSPRSGSR